MPDYLVEYTSVPSATLSGMSLKRTLVRSSMAGALVPLGVMSICHIAGGVFPWPRIAMLLWPTFIFNGLALGSVYSLFGLSVLLFSVALNAILYALVGIILWGLKAKYTNV